jgi:hypothetical protein
VRKIFLHNRIQDVFLPVHKMVGIYSPFLRWAMTISEVLKKVKTNMGEKLIISTKWYAAKLFDYPKVDFCKKLTDLIVDLANKSIGSIHFLRRRSSQGKRSCISSETMITEFIALTKRSWRAILKTLSASSFHVLSV